MHEILWLLVVLKRSKEFTSDDFNSLVISSYSFLLINTCVCDSQLWHVCSTWLCRSMVTKRSAPAVAIKWSLGLGARTLLVVSLSGGVSKLSKWLVEMSSTFETMANRCVVLFYILGCALGGSAVQAGVKVFLLEQVASKAPLVQALSRIPIYSQEHNGRWRPSQILKKSVWPVFF